jgi:hypothetical protein
LAVRAVELLRDLRLNAQRRAPAEPSRPAANAGAPKKIERRTPAGPSGPAVDPEEPKKISPPPPSAEAPGKRLPPPARPRWWLSTGVAVLAAPPSNEPGIVPSLGALLAAGTVLGPRLATIVAVAGPFNSAFSTAANGRATLLQGLATLELRYLFPPHLVQPFVSALIGVNYLQANVPAATPSAGESQVPPVSSVWVPLFGAAGGVAYYLGQRVSFVAEAEIFATAPSTVLELDDTIVARAGAPSVLLTADLSLMLP